jgi:transposase
LAQIGFQPAQTLIVLEATGSYWITLVATLHTALYIASLINAGQAHYFAKSRGNKPKPTVWIAVLCAFALQRQPADWSPPPVVYHELRQRLVARDGLR